jgi:hypothetical protein
MSTQEVWAACQLDLLAASGGNIAAALKAPSPVCSRSRSTRMATTADALEVTDLTGDHHRRRFTVEIASRQARHLRS